MTLRVLLLSLYHFSIACAQTNISLETSSLSESLNLTARQLLPVVTRDGFTFSGIYNSVAPWPLAADSVEALLLSAYQNDFERYAEERDLQAGDIYSWFHGSKTDFMVRAEILHSLGVQPTWEHFLDAISEILEDILHNEWRMVKRAGTAIRAFLNKTPFFDLAISRSGGTRNVLRTSHQLRADGLVFPNRQLGFQTAITLLDDEVYRLGKMADEAGTVPFVPRGYDRQPENKNVRLVLHLDLQNEGAAWPVFKFDAIVALLGAVKLNLNHQGRAYGFGYDLFLGDGPQAVNVGYLQLYQTYIRPLDEAVGSNATQVGNATTLALKALHPENGTADSVGGGILDTGTSNSSIHAKPSLSNSASDDGDIVAVS